jgi:hypothetical protein
MSRLRQYNPNRYISSEAVHAEFENLVRYINAAEVGDMTLGELMNKLFGPDGTLQSTAKFRFDASTGLEVDYGNNAWRLVAPASAMRGSAGTSVGSIDGPVFFNRKDFTSIAGQTLYTYYVAEAASDLLVYVGGILQSSATYVWSRTGQTVSLGVAPATGTIVSIASIRNNSSSTYRRQDFIATSSQAVFPFPHADNEIVWVYRNGILQRSGAGYDFVTSPLTGTITMTTAQTASTLITAIVVENNSLRSVLGLMLEDRYTSDGMIRLDRVAVSDGALAQAKVSGLVAALTLKADCYVSASQPIGSVRGGALWISTARSIPQLFFYDGARWLDPSPQGSIPVPQGIDALRLVRVNSTSSGFEFTDLDLSGVVPVSRIGAPSGVGSLDSSGVAPDSQVAVKHRRTHLGGKIAGSVANSTQIVSVIGANKFLFDSAHYALDSGSCTVQMRVGASDFGLPVAVAAGSVAKQVWTPAVADALATGLAITLIVTSAASSTGLSWSLQGVIS